MKKNSNAIAREKMRPRPRGVFRRFASLGRDVPDPPISIEEIRRRLRSVPSFFDTLSPEALEVIRNWKGPEVMGPPDSKYRLK